MAKPLEDGGVHGLEIVRDNVDADVDIIAVHGLGANSAHAWRYQVKQDGVPTGRNINWLKDDGLLPTEISNARYLAFNYKSTWHKNGHRVTVWALGEELMREINQERESNEKARKRPIIFIGHSFGGIVVEQGIVAASYDGSPYAAVPLCTVGIVLLGTPHAGSSMAAWGSLVGHLSNVFGLGGEKELMDALKEGSPLLGRVVHNFIMWLQKYTVDLAQFYETQRTNYGSFGMRWNEMVVPQESACLAGYPSIPLPCDHLKMAKFDGPYNESYLKIKPVIQAMVKSAPEKARLRFEPRDFVQDNSLIPAVHLECQKALFVSWPDSELQGIKRRLGERTPETCEWLLVKDDYAKWLEGPKPQILRLVGAPGMGKSMILTFLVENMKEKLKVTPNMALAFHFCDNRNQSSNNAQAVVRQMLFQLFQQRPKHFHLLQKAYDVQGGKLFQDFWKMWDIFKEVIATYGEGELFILIDALDECDEDSRKLLLEGLKQISSSEEPKYNARVFFTCRPETDIEKHHRNPHVQTVSCTVDSEDVENDLQKYMRDKVPKLCIEQGWGDTEEKMITAALMEKAKGIFLWCSFVLQDIAKVERKSEIRQCLDDLPKNLQEVYERITHNFKEQSKGVAKMVLEIVAGARRPLRVEELTMTYVLAEDSPHVWRDENIPPKTETDQHDDVYVCCGRLLRYDKVTDTINLVHQSAKDYLLACYLIEKELGDAKLNTRATNVKMNNLFLEIIFRFYSLETFSHLQHRMVFDAEWDIDWEWWEMDPSPPFMVYCGREWELHAKDAEGHALAGKTDGMGRFNTYIRKSTRNSWLRKAAMTGNKPFVEWLLQNDADLDAADFRGWTSLQLAAKHGKENVVEYLSKKMGADLNAEPPHIDGRTPIQTAAEEDNEKMVKLLIKLGAQINNPPAKINGRTALQAAAEKANLKTLKYLLSRNDLDPNVGGAQVSGVTALLAGAGSGGEWQMGKNIHRTIKQRSRLPGSAEIDTQKIAEEDQQDRNQRQLEETNHETVVKMLTSNKKVKLIPNQFNWTALHAAVERESDEMVEAILGIDGVDPNIRGNHDGTPLHSAKAKANEQLAKRLEDAGGSDFCDYSKLDLDAMMKYIRAVLTRLMIKSNTERFFFIQSYIPIYHVIYSYCAEGADDQNDNPPVEQGGRRGELVYRDVDAWLKSYVMWNQKFINDTPAENDFLTVYLREWKLFKRGAYYVGRMLRYLTRHWVKHQKDELKHLDVREIAELFFHRWRAGMTSEIRQKILDEMEDIEDNIKTMAYPDTRALDAINESLGGSFKDYKKIFQEAQEYFEDFNKLSGEGDDMFELKLRDLTEEFVVESELWTANISEDRKEKVKHDKKRAVLLDFKVAELNQQLFSEEAADFYLNTVEPHFLALYSGGRTDEIRRDLDTLWDMLRNNPDEAQQRAKRKAENLNAAAANAEIEVGGEVDGEDTRMTNGIPHTPLKEATEATA